MPENPIVPAHPAYIATSCGALIANDEWLAPVVVHVRERMRPHNLTRGSAVCSLPSHDKWIGTLGVTHPPNFHENPNLEPGTQNRDELR